jgi:hypothetical protein
LVALALHLQRSGSIRELQTRILFFLPTRCRAEDIKSSWRRRCQCAKKPWLIDASTLTRRHYPTFGPCAVHHTLPLQLSQKKATDHTKPPHQGAHTKYQDHLLGHSLKIAKGTSADVQSISLPLVPLGQCIQPTAARRNDIPPVAQKSFDRYYLYPLSQA